MIGTSDWISLVNQIWPSKRRARGKGKEEGEQEEDEGNRETRGLKAGGPARTVALRACISMREGCKKGTLEKRRDVRKARGGRTRGKDTERGTEERRSRRGAEAGGQGQKGWQEETFRTFFVC